MLLSCANNFTSCSLTSPETAFLRRACLTYFAQSSQIGELKVRPVRFLAAGWETGVLAEDTQLAIGTIEDVMGMGD